MPPFLPGAVLTGIVTVVLVINPYGLTVVACGTPDRPSRWGNVTGRGYRGMCLPPG